MNPCPTRRFHVALSATWVVVCLVTSLSCRRGAKDSTTPTTLRIGVGVGASAKDGGLNVLADLLYAEPLIGLDAQGRPVARLAERWEWQDEHRTLRVDLRAGTKLHDGRTLHADLARRFLQHRIDRGQKEGHAGAFDGIETIDTPNDRTMLLHLKRPDAFLLSEFNNALVVDPSNEDIGTGPFRLLSRKPLKVERFADHHRGGPVINQVHIQTYDSQRAAWAALMRDDVDAVQEVNRDSVEFMRGSNNVKTLTSLRPYYWALSFNLKNPQLRRADVRRALNLAVNRDEIVSSALRGYATPALDPVWPLLWAYPTTPVHDSYDLAAARALLEEAHRTQGGPKHLKFRCLFYAEDPQYERMALLLQRQLHEIGVELELQPAALTEMVTKMRRGDFDSFLVLFHSGRALDWTYRFWHSPLAGAVPMQKNGYDGADAVLDQLRVAFTDQEVRRGVAALRERFRIDPPAIFIAWQEITRAVSVRFDVSDADQQDAFANIWQWKPAAKQ